MFGKKKTEETCEITCTEAQELVSNGLDDLFQTLVQGFNKEIMGIIYLTPKLNVFKELTV